MVGALNESQCNNEERRHCISACMPVMYGWNPSQECCRFIREADIECACAGVTPVVAALIDINRLIKVVEWCGRSVQHHYKCG
ncbi:hypothetical protein FRX31_032058, partial [Thalictrum thalictroides]